MAVTNKSDKCKPILVLILG